VRCIDLPPPPWETRASRGGMLRPAGGPPRPVGRPDDAAGTRARRRWSPRRRTAARPTRRDGYEAFETRSADPGRRARVRLLHRRRGSRARGRPADAEHPPARRVVRGRLVEPLHRQLRPRLLGRPRVRGRLRRLPRHRHLGAREPEGDRQVTCNGNQGDVAVWGNILVRASTGPRRSRAAPAKGPTPRSV